MIINVKVVKASILCSLSFLLLFSGVFGSAISNAFAQGLLTGNGLSTGSNNTNASLATLRVIDHTYGSSNSLTNIRLTINNLARTSDGFILAVHFVRGLVNGTTSVNLLPGIFGVADQRNLTNTRIQIYNVTFSGDCTIHKTANGTTFGSGSINLGEAKTCIVSNYIASN